MSRDIDIALKNASKMPAIISIVLAQLKYDSGDINLHTAIGNIEFNGDTYIGIGNFGSITTIEENSDLSTNYLDLSLSGIDPALVSTQFNEYYQGRPATIWFALLDTTTYQLITPTIIYKGTMDNSQIELGETATIILRVNNRLALWNKPNNSRYNNADQQTLFPGDLGFEFVEELQEENVAWGKSVNNPNAVPLSRFLDVFKG